MTATREHLAGLELVKRQVSITNPLAAEQLEYLIDQAQSVPDPVQGEVAWVAVDQDGAWSEPQATRAHAQTLADDMSRALPPSHEGQACRVMALYTAAAKPDAELVELLRDERLHGRNSPSCQEGMVFKCKCRRCRFERIDAKLASLKGEL